jgi:osmotically inducible protein OsmC
MQHSATAVWKGSLKAGKGTLTTASGVLSATPYSFLSRFEQGSGTNPEELIAAAHAGCFAMALSAQLGEAGLTPESIQTQCTITLERTANGFAITKSHLNVVAKIPGASREVFEKAAGTAKANCPVSKLLTAQITMDASLEA